MNVKDAVHATVREYPGGADSLAPRMGIKSPAVLRSKANPTIDTHHMRLDEAVTMMSLTGDHRIMHAMAGEIGGAYEKLASVDTLLNESIIGMVLGAAARHGDLCGEFKTALEDGELSMNELETIDTRLGDSINQLFALRQLIKARKELKK